jgi:IS30 family transposase
MRHGRLDHRQVWAQYAAGQLPAEIGRSMGRPPDAIYSMIRKTGGICPALRVRSSIQLSLAEREETSRGLAAGISCRSIATSLGHAPSTVTREINRNGGPTRYRAVRADGAAWKASTRPKVPKLAAHPALAEVVAKRLKKRCRRSRSLVGYAGPILTSRSCGCHTRLFYRALVVQTKGALNHELTGYLRTKRVMRRPRGANRFKAKTMGQIADMVNIRERPAEATDRAVPGHWEGDLICGTGGSTVATLVERSTRFTQLVRIEKITSETVAAALGSHIGRSLTWDQGKEMARHVQFIIDTGVAVYFCDPKSPWQRGTNENTNGLIRQYLPKRTDLRPHTQADLDAIALELNGRPRKTLGFMTPSEEFAEAVAPTP